MVYSNSSFLKSGEQRPEEDKGASTSHHWLAALDRWLARVFIDSSRLARSSYSKTQLRRWLPG